MLKANDAAASENYCPAECSVVNCICPCKSMCVFWRKIINKLVSPRFQAIQGVFGTNLDNALKHFYISKKGG